MSGELTAEEFQIALAQRDAMADALKELVAIVDRIGGYMEYEKQADIRNARALLAEYEAAK
jgi:hypothetical protein